MRLWYMCILWSVYSKKHLPCGGLFMKWRKGNLSWERQRVQRGFENFKSIRDNFLKLDPPIELRKTKGSKRFWELQVNGQKKIICPDETHLIPLVSFFILDKLYIIMRHITRCTSIVCQRMPLEVHYLSGIYIHVRWESKIMCTVQQSPKCFSYYNLFFSAM